jgi:hypothetical protein
MSKTKELIEEMEKNNVPLPFALKIFHRAIHKEREPLLPGFTIPQISYQDSVGTVNVGIIDKNNLKPKDIEFYRRCEEVDTCPLLWGTGEAVSVYESSVLRTDIEHEKLFNRRVAEKISEKIKNNGETTWVDIGIGEAEEVKRVYDYLDKENTKGKMALIGVDRFKGMLKKSLKSKVIENFEYHPIVADANHLPLRKLDAIFTLNTNTPGNFTRSERESLDSNISQSMSKDAVILKSVYYAPRYRDKWREACEKSVIAHSYFRNLPSARVASQMDEKERSLEEALTKPLWTWQVFNELTNSVEGYIAQWKSKGFKISPIYRSHRFTRKELKESADRANLDISIDRDGNEKMYLVELSKH